MKNLRNRHLREAAKRLMASAGPFKDKLTLRRLTAAVIAQPAPDYYVTLDHAMRMLSCRRRGKLPMRCMPKRREMWNEIFQRVDAVRRRYPYLSEREAVERVLTAGRASSFFIDLETAVRILRKTA